MGAAPVPQAVPSLRCQLMPLRRTEFSVAFTVAQWTTLSHTFPHGVCDWSKPGIGQQPTIPWLSYQSPWRNTTEIRADFDTAAGLLMICFNEFACREVGHSPPQPRTRRVDP
jgi:Tannase-like family of unknown function (DUF6351)